MKTNIHPGWYKEAKITCACGNTFTTGATVEELRVDVCSACHPFYTGQMKYVDTAGRVDAFRSRQQQAGKKVISKTEKRRIKRDKKILKEMERPDSLSELRKQAKSSKKS